MQISVFISDAISPRLRELLAKVTNRRPILQAIGAAVANMAQRAFTVPSLRPTPWDARKKGYSHPILRKSGNLMQSIHVEAVGNDSVKVGTPARYGAVHQFGFDGEVTRAEGTQTMIFRGGRLISRKAARRQFEVGADGKRRRIAAVDIRLVKTGGTYEQHIPPRPFFPIIGGPDDARLTEQAEAAIRRAAVQALGIG